MSRNRNAHKPSSARTEAYYEKLEFNKIRKRFSPDDYVYTHCIARVVDDTCGSSRSRYSFNDEDKDMILTVIKQMLKKYKIDCLGYCVMSTHFHILLSANNDKYSPSEACLAYNNAYAKAIENGKVPMNESSPDCQRLASHSNDISWLMKDILKVTANKYNKRYERSGHLWKERFKSVLVERATALKNMSVYIELNPVRAKICERAEQYRWSSFAEWKTTGKHPFQQAFSKHFKKLLAEDKQNISDKDELFRAYEEAINLRLMKDQKSKAESLIMERQLYSNAFAVGSIDFIKAAKIIKPPS